MSFFTYFFVTIPAMRLPDIIIHVVAMLGAILLAYAIFLEAEKWQDVLFMLGGFCLLVYALWIPNYIFMVAMGLLTLTAGYEFVQILTGRHRH